MSLNQCPLHGAVSPQPGFTGPGIQCGNGRGAHSLLQHPSDLLAKFFIPVPVTSCSATYRA